MTARGNRRSQRSRLLPPLFVHQRLPLPSNQVHGGCGVIGCKRMLQSIIHSVICSQPRTRPPMQHSNLHLAILQAQLLLQELLKQLMIAKPVVPFIQRRQKQISVLQPIQISTTVTFGIIAIRDRLAQWPAKAIKNGGLDEEFLDRGRQLCDHLGRQVVHDVAIGALGINRGAVRSPVCR